MKRIFTILAIMVGLVLPMQAQLAPVSKAINKSSMERSLKRKVKAESSEITINDLVGTFESYAMSAFQGYPDEQWKLTITLDENDANKVWLQPIMQIAGLALTDIAPIYATYSQETGTLTIPLGQSIYGGEGKEMNIVIATCDENSAPIYTGEIALSVTGTPSDIVIMADFLLGCGDVVSDGWWYQAYMQTIFNKFIPEPAVYVTLNDGENSVVKVNTEELYFVDYENETYLSTTPEYVSDAIAGTYNAYAISAFQGEPDESWEMTITRDENDANKVWIDPILEFGGLTANELNAVYGTFDESAGTITIPLGQVLFEEPGYTMILGEADVNNNFAPITNGDLVVTVVNDGRKFIEIPNVIGVGNLDEGDNGWWYQGLAYTTFTSVESIIAPLSEIGTVSRKISAPEIEGFFDEGTYTWSFLISEDDVNWESLSTKTQFEYSGIVDLGDFYGQGAAGIVAYEWNISGFMDDLGYFELNNGTAANFKGYSYNLTYEGSEFECLDLLDPSGNPLTIGSITLKNQDGSTFLTDVYLGEFSGSNIYYNLGFVVDGDVAMYNGDSAILWFILNNQAYMLASYDELTISRNNAPYAARKATKINFYEQPIAVKSVGGFKKASFSK